MTDGVLTIRRVSMLERKKIISKRMAKKIIAEYRSERVRDLMATFTDDSDEESCTLFRLSSRAMLGSDDTDHE